MDEMAPGNHFARLEATEKEEQEVTARRSGQLGHWAGSTHWSAVPAVGQRGSPGAAAAMEDLCRTYWYPLYAYVRRRGYEVEEAQDLTQEFFAKMIENHWLKSADSKRGKFRSFLFGAMSHFLANDWRRAHTLKRGGGRCVIYLDDTAERRYALNATTDLTPEKMYERRWAWSLFDRAVSRLREQYASDGKGRLYDALKGFLADDIVEGDYARLAAQLQMTHGAVATSVHRLRERYRELVREEVAHTVADPAETEDEMRSLLASLS
jgi:DNA-directed RNA polymerase specialized sigma24 family protein